MEPESRHIVAELSGCRTDLLENVDIIREIIVKAVILADCEVREVATYKYSPQGVSGVVILAESHLSIHTWPENSYAAVDIFTCGKTAKPEKACEYIARCLEAKSSYVSILNRGLMPNKKDVFVHSYCHPFDILKDSA
jgi:S-adenosylmethionine decarboxylase